MKITTAQTAAYYATFVLLGAMISSLGPTIPFLAGNVGVTLAVMGSMFAIRSVGYLVGSFSGGWLYDKLPGHRLLAGLLLLGAVGMILTPLAPIPLLLSIALLLVGLAMGGMDVGSNTQLVWVHAEHSGPYLNGLFLFAGIGGFFAPLLLNWADRIVGTQWGYFGIALLTIPVILWLLRIPAPTRREHQDGEAERPLKPLVFAAFCILVFTFIGGEVGFSGWIYTYIVESGVGDEAGAALLNSLFWLAMSAGRLAAIPLSARFRPSQLVLFNLVATFCSLGLIVLLPGRTAAVWVGSLASGFFLSSIFPTSFAFLERQMDITGWRTGVIWSFGSMGGITLPWLLGVQIDASGPQSMMYILSALWGIAVLIFAMVFFRTRLNRTARFAS